MKSNLDQKYRAIAQRAHHTDKELAELLPALTPLERVEVVIAKYVGGCVSMAYNGENTAAQSSAQIAHHLACKIRRHVPELIEPKAKAS